MAGMDQRGQGRVAGLGSRGGQFLVSRAIIGLLVSTVLALQITLWGETDHPGVIYYANLYSFSIPVRAVT